VTDTPLSTVVAPKLFHTSTMPTATGLTKDMGSAGAACEGTIRAGAVTIKASGMGRSTAVQAAPNASY
jgi:hypothetical protein